MDGAIDKVAIFHNRLRMAADSAMRDAVVITRQHLQRITGQTFDVSLRLHDAQRCPPTHFGRRP